MRFCSVAAGLCSFILLLAALNGPAYSQATTLGQIVGTIEDPSNASVPGAKVRVLNTGTGVARELVSDANGNFAALSLIPGTYSVEVTAPSFQKQIQEGLKLDVAGTITLTFRLTVGQITESIKVEAEAELLKTTEGVIATTVDNTKVVELPLNGRNFGTLVRLTPGATRGNTGTGNTLNTVNFAVTGSRSDNSNYTIDGTSNNGTFFKTAAVAQSVDAINEFKVQTNMSAKYGAAAGANINVSTKSGTNQYHGSLYEFLRNANLDSRDYFAARRPAFKFNQFGFTVGGPLSIPKMYDARNKTFFFFNYEGFQQRRSATQVGTIPNAAWLRGDLSRNLDGVTPMPQLYDPFTDRQTGTNAQGQPIYTRTAFPNNQIPQDRIPAYAKAYLNLWYPGLTPSNLNTGNFINTTGSPREDNQVTTRIDQKISEHNNLFGRFTWSDLYQQTPQNLPTANQVTYNKYLSATLSDTHIFNPTTILDFRLGYLRANNGQGPTHKFIDVYRSAGLQNVPTNFRQFDFPVNFNVTGVTGPGNGNLINGPDWTYQGALSMSKVAGRHQIGFGYDYTQIRMIADSVFVNFDFNALPTADPQNVSSTGHPFASFLLGTPSGGGRISGESDLDTDQKLHQLWFQDDIRVNSRLTINIGLRYELNAWPHHRRLRMGGFDMTTGQFYWTGVNPITGAPPNAPPTITEPEYQKKNWAPRFGFAYRLGTKTVVRSAYGIFYNSNFGWEYSTGRGNWPYSISDNISGVNIAGTQAKRADQFFGSFDPKLVPPLTQHTIARDLQVPYMQNWNFGIEHQITQSLLLEVNYQGAKGTHLTSFLNTNEAPPGPGDPNPRRPYPQAGAMSELRMTATSRYNGLTAKAEQRLWKGLTYIASYAYQKNIDLNSSFGGTTPQDAKNARASMGPSDFDQTHVFNTGYSYFLPGPVANKALKLLLGGWQTSGIVTLETGRPFTLGIPFDNANTGPRSNGQRPNLVGNPYPSGWTKTYGPGGLYFDPRAFAVPPQYTYGNMGRNAMRGPGFRNFDLTLMKNFNFTERVRLQYRAEAFNAFNNTNFGNPGTSITTPNFGRILGTQNAQRSIQMGLKLYF